MRAISDTARMTGKCSNMANYIKRLYSSLMLHFSSLIRDVHTVYAAVNFFANISGQVYKQPTICESTPYSFLFRLKMFDIELCVYGIRDAVESVLAVGYS